MPFIDLAPPDQRPLDKLTEMPRVATYIMMIEDCIDRALDGAEELVPFFDGRELYSIGQMRKAKTAVELLRECFRAALVQLSDALGPH